MHLIRATSSIWYLLNIACNWALLTLSSDGNPLSSQSSGLSWLWHMNSLLIHASSHSFSWSPLIWSFIISNGPRNHSHTLSSGQFTFFTSTSSAAKEKLRTLLKNPCIMNNIHWNWTSFKVQNNYLQMRKPGEFDFADLKRHCKIQ